MFDTILLILATFAVGFLVAYYWFHKKPQSASTARPPLATLPATTKPFTSTPTTATTTLTTKPPVKIDENTIVLPNPNANIPKADPNKKTTGPESMVTQIKNDLKVHDKAAKKAEDRKVEVIVKQQSEPLTENSTTLVKDAHKAANHINDPQVNLHHPPSSTEVAKSILYNGKNNLSDNGTSSPNTSKKSLLERPPRGRFDISQLTDLTELRKVFSDPITGVPVKDRKSKSKVIDVTYKTHKNCFIGSEAVDWLVANVSGVDRRKAAELGLRLWAGGLFVNVPHASRPFSDDKHLFRFLSYYANPQLHSSGSSASAATSSSSSLSSNNLSGGHSNLKRSNPVLSTPGLAGSSAPNSTGSLSSGALLEEDGGAEGHKHLHAPHLHLHHQRRDSIGKQTVKRLFGRSPNGMTADGKRSRRLSLKSNSGSVNRALSKIKSSNADSVFNDFDTSKPLYARLKRKAAWMPTQEVGGWTKRWCVLDHQGNDDDQTDVNADVKNWELRIYGCITDRAAVELLQALLNPDTGVKVKDRRSLVNKLKVHRASFVGKHAVSWCVKSGRCATRPEAVELMNSMVRKGLISRARTEDKHTAVFRDEKHSFYRVKDVILPDHQELLNSDKDSSEITTVPALAVIPLTDHLTLKLDDQHKNHVHAILYNPDGQRILQVHSSNGNNGIRKSHPWTDINVENKSTFGLRFARKHDSELKSWILAFEAAIVLSSSISTHGAGNDIPTASIPGRTIISEAELLDTPIGDTQQHPLLQAAAEAAVGKGGPSTSSLASSLEHMDSLTSTPTIMSPAVVTVTPADVETTSVVTTSTGAAVVVEDLVQDEEESAADAVAPGSKPTADLLIESERVVLDEMKNQLRQELGTNAPPTADVLDAQVNTAMLNASDFQLLMFLRCRKLIVPAAITLMRASYRYRIENNLMHLNVTQSGPAVLGKNGDGSDAMLVLNPNGRDRQGRALLFIRPQYYKPKEISPMDIVRGVMYMMDCAQIGNDEISRGGFTVLVDCKGSKYGNFDRKMPRPVLDAIVSRYPARIGYVVIVNAPWFFKFVWAVLRPMLSEVLAAKFHVLDASNASMEEFVPSDQILADIGGTSNYDSREWVRQRCQIEGVPYPVRS